MIRYIKYNKDIYVVFGISQDKFNNYYFHIFELNEIKQLIATNSLNTINNRILTNNLVAVDDINVNEITNKSRLNFIKMLYE